jgi:hypothetical protein
MLPMSRATQTDLVGQYSHTDNLHIHPAMHQAARRRGWLLVIIEDEVVI